MIPPVAVINQGLYVSLGESFAGLRYPRYESLRCSLRFDSRTLLCRVLSILRPFHDRWGEVWNLWFEVVSLSVWFTIQLRIRYTLEITLVGNSRELFEIITWLVVLPSAGRMYTSSGIEFLLFLLKSLRPRHRSFSRRREVELPPTFVVVSSTTISDKSSLTRRWS